MSVRRVAACVAVALWVTVPLQPMLAAAQQTNSNSSDGYAVGAAIMTVIGAPVKAAVCLVGGAVGLTLFLTTFGYADRQSAAVVREGCDQRWLVRAEHLRPDPGPERVLRLDPDPEARAR